MLNKKNYIKPFKITKQPLKHPKFAGKVICNRMNSGGASSQAPPPLAARGFTRRRWKTKKTGVPGRFPPLRLPKPPVTCRTRK